MDTRVERTKERTEKVSSEAEYAQQLADRIRAGDSSAEHEMVSRYQRGLCLALYNRARDRALAEDTAQDTWERVIQKVRDGELREHSKLAAFIVQIGKNLLIAKYRSYEHRHARSFDEETNQLTDAALTPEQSAENKQLGHTIAQLLDNMPVVRDREILTRYYVVGDEKDNICADFELTTEHFDRVLHRARQRFKALWNAN